MWTSTRTRSKNASLLSSAKPGEKSPVLSSASRRSYHDSKSIHDERAVRLAIYGYWTALGWSSGPANTTQLCGGNTSAYFPGRQRLKAWAPGVLLERSVCRRVCVIVNDHECRDGTDTGRGSWSLRRRTRGATTVYRERAAGERVGVRRRATPRPDA